MMCMTELCHRTSTPHKSGNKMKEKKKRSLIPPGPNTPFTQYINCSCNDVFHLEEKTLGVRVLLEKVTSPRHFVSRVHRVCDHTNVFSGDHNTQFPIITEYRKLFLIPKLEGPYPQVD